MHVECDEYLTGNQGLPSNLETGTCPYCNNFVFLSFAEKKKHLSVFHADYKGDGKKIWKMEHRCLFIIKDKQGSNRCNVFFKSANQLLEHRQKAKHTHGGGWVGANLPRDFSNKPEADVFSDHFFLLSVFIPFEHYRVISMVTGGLRAFL